MCKKPTALRDTHYFSLSNWPSALHQLSTTPTTSPYPPYHFYRPDCRLVYMHQVVRFFKPQDLPRSGAQPPRCRASLAARVTGSPPSLAWEEGSSPSLTTPI